jgi:hypothetical protein
LVNKPGGYALSEALWLDPAPRKAQFGEKLRAGAIMASTPPPFARFEWMIAWRYLRARRAEGGVSVMTWISLIGITLAVFALIATLAVRSGFRSEFVGTILGANAHVTLYSHGALNEAGQMERSIKDFDAMAARVAEVPGVIRAFPALPKAMAPWGILIGSKRVSPLAQAWRVNWGSALVIVSS